MCLELFLVSMIVVLTSELELFAVTAFVVVQQMPSPQIGWVFARKNKKEKTAKIEPLNIATW